MARTFFSAALLAIVGLSGCMHTAKEVSWDQKGGVVVVAIPENSNVWPTYYQDAAYEKIRERYPNFNPSKDFVKIEPVVVGKETINDKVTDRKTNGDRTTSVTKTSDQTEYWVEYRMTPTTTGINAVVPTGGTMRPNVNGVMNNNITQTGGVGKPTTSFPSNTGVPSNGQPQFTVDPRTNQPVFTPPTGNGPTNFGNMK